MDGPRPLSTESRRRRRRVPFAFLTLLMIATSCTGGDSTSSPPLTGDSGTSETGRPESDQILIGVSSPFEEERNLLERIEALEREVIAREFGAVRVYHRWDEPFPTDSERRLSERGTTIILSVSTQRKDLNWIPWRDLASAPAGSVLASDLANWASMIASVPGPVIVTLDHEADFYRNGGDGEPTDYIAAYRSFAAAVRAASPETQLLWVGVAYFFRPDQDVRAPDFFPGLDAVDMVGADGFNWSTCRDDPGSWRTFEEIFAPFAEWHGAAADGVPIVLAEVGSVDDLDDPDRKPAWLRDAAQTMSQPEWADLRAIALWDNVHENNPACDFRLDSSVRVEAALAAIAARKIFQIET